MLITQGLFADGLRITGKTSFPTEFLSAEEREARKAMTPEQREKAALNDRLRAEDGGLLVDIAVIVDTEVFGEEADELLKVRIPESSLKGFDLVKHAYTVVRFRNLQISVSGVREAPTAARAVRMNFTADGIESKPQG